MDKWITIALAAILGSALLASFATNWQMSRQRRKEIVAAATKSALKRVEMYYRILRRDGTNEDSVAIRDLFHTIQENNDYYESLLNTETVWLGYAYGRFITELKRETMPSIQKAWDGKAYGPGAKLQGLTTLDNDRIKHLTRTFNNDSRRLFNPIMRIAMRFEYTFRRYFKDQYGSK